MAKKVAIAGLGHPTRLGEMAGVDMATALRLETRINSEEDFNDLLPIGTVGGGVEQPRIEPDVCPVVFHERAALGRRIIERFDHWLSFESARVVISVRDSIDMTMRVEAALSATGDVMATSPDFGHSAIYVPMVMDQQDSLSTVGR